MRRRGARAAFGEQLPDVLQLIAGSLQSGFSLPQAVDAVVREGTQPSMGEFSAPWPRPVWAPIWRTR